MLAKCTIADPTVYRNDIGEFFSDEPSPLNANGHKRLGGRMALLMRVAVRGSTTSVVVSVTHKLVGFGEHLRQYIGDSAAVVGGDQDWGFCERAGLVHVDNKSHPTWPASCTSTGQGRGDILCSNMHVSRTEQTFLPCFEASAGI